MNAPFLIIFICKTDDYISEQKAMIPESFNVIKIKKGFASSNQARIIGIDYDRITNTAAVSKSGKKVKTKNSGWLMENLLRAYVVNDKPEHFIIELEKGEEIKKGAKEYLYCAENAKIASLLYSSFFSFSSLFCIFLCFLFLFFCRENSGQVEQTSPNEEEIILLREFQIELFKLSIRVFQFLSHISDLDQSHLERTAIVRKMKGDAEL